MADKIRQQKIVKYLNKDFDGFKSDMLEFAKTHYSDVISDFSDASVGGLFLDFFSYVGDVTSNYLDHKFNELFIDSAREPKNVKRIAKQLGLKPRAPSPATVDCSFFIEAPIVFDVNGNVMPDTNTLFKLRAGSTVEADNGTVFELQDTIDFSNIISSEELQISQRDSTGQPTKVFVKKGGFCISGTRKTFSITIPNTYVKFRKIEIPERDVTEIIRVTDSEGNRYFEVDYLTQDTVFEAIENEELDKKDVPLLLKIKPVPFRFVSDYDIETELTTLTFGSGQAGTVDDDIVSDPSEFALPFYGKRTLTRFSINPEQFLKTRTMGVSPMGTTLTIEVRLGGGLTHNVAEKSINTVNGAIIDALTTNFIETNAVIQTLDVTNSSKATGGDDKQTLEELKSNAAANFASQNRLVTREDYLSRIYSMPTKFGRVYRVAVQQNTNSSQSIQIHILSRDSRGKLTIAPDALKRNLKVFLNEFRMITDSVDILDTRIINLGLDFSIVTNSKFNKTVVLNNTLKRLISFFKIENFQIGQSIIIDEVKSLIYNTEGVVSISNLKFNNFSGLIGGVQYSNDTLSVSKNTLKGILICPDDSIFEVRNVNKDIRGAAT